MLNIAILSVTFHLREFFFSATAIYIECWNVSPGKNVIGFIDLFVIWYITWIISRAEITTRPRMEALDFIRATEISSHGYFKLINVFLIVLSGGFAHPVAKGIFIPIYKSAVCLCHNIKQHCLHVLTF